MNASILRVLLVVGAASLTACRAPATTIPDPAQWSTVCDANATRTLACAAPVGSEVRLSERATRAGASPRVTEGVVLSLSADTIGLLRVATDADAVARARADTVSIPVGSLEEIRRPRMRANGERSRIGGLVGGAAGLGITLVTYCGSTPRICDKGLGGIGKLIAGALGLGLGYLVGASVGPSLPITEWAVVWRPGWDPAVTTPPAAAGGS